MDNRRLFLAAILSMGVLVAWQFLFPPPPPPTVAPPVAAGSSDPAYAAAPGLASAGSTPPAAGSPPAAAAGESAPLAAPVPVLEPIEAAAESAIVLETADLRAELSNRGAQLRSLVVKGKKGEEGEPLELVQRRTAPPYPFALIDAAGAGLALNDALYEVTREENGDGPSATFRYRGPLGESSKRFRLRPDGRIDFEIEASSAGFGVLLGPGLRVRTEEELASRLDRRGAVWSDAGEVVVQAPADTEAVLPLAGRTLEWVGLEDTYFLVAAVAESGLAEARIEPVLLAPVPPSPGAEEGLFEARPLPVGRELGKEEKKLARDLRVVLVADDGRLTGTSYWGSKQYDRLAAMPWGLERTVHWGMLGFLAQPLLRALQWIHAQIVPNYGWAIVILTAVLKIVLLPLSLASFKSMRKMQKLNPRMQAIREKWRGKLRDKNGRFVPDAQRQMNEEIMGVYRAEGVNPVGGCLPVLVQLPIFFAFYQLLSTAVELWHSPWLLWVKDLTAPDAYYVLPLVMGATQIIQQRMTPPPPDPIQRKMIQAMPFVFTIFSLGFASGLVLYWLTNNVLSIVQQKLYNDYQDRHQEPATATVAASAKGKGSRKP